MSLFSAPLGAIFLTYVGFIGLLLASSILLAFRGRSAFLGISLLLLWLVYVGGFSYFGLLRDPALKPPGIVLMVGPVLVALILLIGRSAAGLNLATRLPLAFLIGVQVFRVGVELTIHQLHVDGLAPQLLTLEGGNIELIFAISAPLVAWMSIRTAGGRRLVLLWNIIGLLSLFNVATRAILSSPGSLNFLHTEVPNVGFGVFPFGYIPGFMAPLALALHVLTFRALGAARRDVATTLLASKTFTAT